MEMTFTAILNRCVDDRNYPAYMKIQNEVDKDLKKTQGEMETISKAEKYYDCSCIKHYELEIEKYKLLIEFYEKLIAIKKLNSMPELKYRVEAEGQTVTLELVG